MATKLSPLASLLHAIQAGLASKIRRINNRGTELRLPVLGTVQHTNPARHVFNGRHQLVKALGRRQALKVIKAERREYWGY